MNTTELRLGNIISYRGETDCIVTSLGSNGFETIKDDKYQNIYGSDDVNEYEGIELTEEWLIKFGFEIKTTLSGHKYIQFGIIRIYLSNKFCDYFSVHFVVSEEWCPCIVVSIYFVHQLQNFYFVLTGEELKQIEL